MGFRAFRALDIKNCVYQFIETNEFDGQEIRREYCPISGRYQLTYNVDDGQEDKVECPTTDSELDNCPSGSAMNLRFRKCSFENHGKEF